MVTCDLQVDVNGDETFFVDRNFTSLTLQVLSSLSGGKVRELISSSFMTSAAAEPPKVVALRDFPGGAEAFELMKRCYYNNGSADSIVPADACLVHSIPRLIEMADDVSSSTNLSRLIDGIPYWPWNVMLGALKQCQGLLPASAPSVMLDKLVESAVGRIIAARDAASPTGSSPESSSALRFSSDTASSGRSGKISSSTHRAWWLEDLIALDPRIIERIVNRMIAHKLNHAWISRFLMHYMKRTSFEKENVAQVVIDLLYSLDGGCVSCKGLFCILQISSSLKLSPSCKDKLEAMIGKQFDQATLDNLLVPAPAGEGSLYDVDLVLRFLKSFMASDIRESTTQLKVAGSLLDSFLAEVAPDSSLKPMKFWALTIVLPDEARDSHNALYRAIDMYLQVHNQLSEQEKIKICSAINYEKLSSDSCTHLASNGKLPSRAAAGALFFQQRKLSNRVNKFFGQRSADEPIILYAKKLDVAAENAVLKCQVQGMQCKLKEMERMCRKLQKQIAMRTRKPAVPSPIGSSSLPRLCS